MEVLRMKIIKRDGHMVDYCPEKIEIAIKKANSEVEVEQQATDIQIKNIHPKPLRCRQMEPT